MTRTRQQRAEDQRTVLVPDGIPMEKAIEEDFSKATVVGKYGEKMIVSGVCRHCGANRMQPTKDGKHACQCRSERVTA